MMPSLIAAALIGLMPAPAWAQGERPNFTGKWVLDLSKSDFGQFPPPESIVQAIEHDEPNLQISTTTRQANQNGEPITNVLKLTTDGRENTNRLRMMANEHEVRSTVRWEGGKLAGSTKFEIRGAAIEFNDSWGLSEDRRVLTLVRTIRTPQGDVTVKTVYSKQ